jgi:hypothetical protein
MPDISGRPGSGQNQLLRRTDEPYLIYFAPKCEVISASKDSGVNIPTWIAFTIPSGLTKNEVGMIAQLHRITLQIYQRDIGN